MLIDTGNRTLRLLRALWRYRGRLEQHGVELQEDLAVTVRSAIDARPESAAALSGYRLTMRLFTVGWIVLMLLGLMVAVALYTVKPLLALLGLLLVVPGIALLLVRRAWGMPLDWLTQHDDPSRTIPARDVPERLRVLAAKTATLGNVPRAITDELDALAAERESETA